MYKAMQQNTRISRKCQNIDMTFGYVLIWGGNPISAAMIPQSPVRPFHSTSTFVCFSFFFLYTCAR